MFNIEEANFRVLTDLQLWWFGIFGIGYILASVYWINRSLFEKKMTPRGCTVLQLLIAGLLGVSVFFFTLIWLQANLLTGMWSPSTFKGRQWVALGAAVTAILLWQFLMRWKDWRSAWQSSRAHRRMLRKSKEIDSEIDSK